MTHSTFAPHSFDHTALAELPEYHAFRKALSDLANATGGLDAATIHAAASSSYAGDWCRCCHDHDVRDQTCWPFYAEVSGGFLRGLYRCPRTGKVWRCSYTADVGLMASL